MNQDIGARILAARNDPIAINDIIKEYLPFIASVTSKVCKRQVEYGVDDELSIAMLGFHDAAATYAANRGAFLKYASVVMSNRVVDYLRKESKHRGEISIQQSGDGPDSNLENILSREDGRNADIRLATREEISELGEELAGFGITFSDLTTFRPKQERTMNACGKAGGWALQFPDKVAEMKRTKKLPIAHICEHTGLDRKTLDRHRKYIIAVVVIYSNGYEIIRGHLSQVLIVRSARDGGQHEIHGN